MQTRAGRRRAGFIFVVGLCFASIACSSILVRHPGKRGGDLERDATNTCPNSPADRCALDSPLMKLADRAALASRDGERAHYATILDDGTDALRARVHAIRAARRSIEIQVFIWTADTVGAAMLGELQEAARRGVKVRLILDQLASSGDIDLATVLAVAHENLEVRYYRPVAKKIDASWLEYIWSAVHRTWRTQQRMHNKIFVVDDRLLIAGGRNIADEYYDVHPEFNFIDRDVLLAGPVAARARESFEEYWRSDKVVPVHELHDVRLRLFKDGKQLPVASSVRAFRNDFKSVEHIMERVEDRAYIQKVFADRAYRVGDVAFIADLPEKGDSNESAEESGTLREIQTRLAGAQSSILIQTPYLLLTEENLEGLQQLNRERPGVRVRASTNSLSATDNLLVYGVYYKLRTEYLDTTNIEIREFKGRPRDGLRLNRNYIALARATPAEKDEWRRKLRENPDLPLSPDLPGPGFGMHAKSIVIDERSVMIGSHNFDPRSTAINNEVLITIEDADFARAVVRSVEKHMDPGNSWAIAPKAHNALTPANECLGSASRSLPVFDVYPWTGSASFQKISGGEDLSRSDPAFYENFENVGQYPDTGLLARAGTWLVSAFGVLLIHLL
ncbi:MAG: phospholipase D family protein [bacterium]|nr:phospholipase D family protein [bacterium]